MLEIGFREVVESDREDENGSLGNGGSQTANPRDLERIAR